MRRSLRGSGRTGIVVYVRGLGEHRRVLAVARMLGVVVAASSTLLTKCVPIGIFAGVSEFGIVMVRCVIVWLWAWTLERVGLGLLQSVLREGEGKGLGI